MNVDVNGTIYPVVFGTVYHVTRTEVPPVNYMDLDQPGRSMDAMIEVWTTTTGNVRVQQRAMLINNCSYLCSTSGTSFCPAKVVGVHDDGVVYHRIEGPANWPDVGTALRACRGGRRVGDVDASDCAAGHADRIDVADLVVLRNHLRTGTYAGTCDGIMNDAGGACGACNSGGAGSCGDINGDGLVDETDLNILEKILRGYLNVTP